MEKFIDRRYGKSGKGFWFYAFGPIFFAALLIYFIVLYIQAGSESDERLLFFGVTIVLVVILIVDSLAVYEARWTIRKAELHDDLIHFTPLWGRAFESSRDEIIEIRPARSFGYIPGISLIDNNRSNIEVVFKNRPSVFLFGNSEADQWIKCIAKQDESERMGSE